ncbi:hypothetical protein SK128_023197, partial [Halocaridina rubra]
YRLAVDGRTCEAADACSVNNGGCLDLCREELGRARCSCRMGLTLAEDQVSCTDVDECQTPGICSHRCQNTWGSYQCLCNSGYQLGTDLRSCYMIDMEVINSCLDNNGGCKHMCKHGPGGAMCSCHAGYLLQPDQRSCEDEDECSTGSHRCQQECVNTPGGYACACHNGYALSTDGFSCNDVDECERENGGCEHDCRNTAGSFVCSCRRGYILVERTRCNMVDYDYTDEDYSSLSSRGDLDISTVLEDDFNVLKGSTSIVDNWENITYAEQAKVVTIHTRCVPGYFGPNCTLQCSDCPGECDLEAEGCICETGKSGPVCDQPCPKGFYGPGCNQASSLGNIPGGLGVRIPFYKF